MKEHFIKLLDYDRHSNLQLLPVIIKTGQPQRAVEVMAHILSVQQIWLDRCNGSSSATAFTAWPNWTADTFEATIHSNHADWLAFLDNTDLSHSIDYKNLAGTPFNSKLIDIYTHMINHGTHHRGQIGQLLKFAGAPALPATDYIAFTRF